MTHFFKLNKKFIDIVFLKLKKNFPSKGRLILFVVILVYLYLMTQDPVRVILCQTWNIEFIDTNQYKTNVIDRGVQAFIIHSFTSFEVIMLFHRLLSSSQNRIQFIIRAASCRTAPSDSDKIHFRQNGFESDSFLTPWQKI